MRSESGKHSNKQILSDQVRDIGRTSALAPAPKYRPARQAVPGEEGQGGGSGPLPAPTLGQLVDAQSRPEREARRQLQHRPYFVEPHPGHRSYPCPHPFPSTRGTGLVRFAPQPKTHRALACLSLHGREGALGRALLQIKPGDGARQLPLCLAAYEGLDFCADLSAWHAMTTDGGVYAP